MANRRKGWDSLSQAYRKRLGRAGISERDYKDGASLRGARGHRATPERPGQAERHPERFREYNERKAKKRTPGPNGPTPSSVDDVIRRIESADSKEAGPGGSVDKLVHKQSVPATIVIAQKLGVENAVPHYSSYTQSEQYKIAVLWLEAFMTHARAADSPELMMRRYELEGIYESLLSKLAGKYGQTTNSRQFYQAFRQSYTKFFTNGQLPGA